MGKCCLRNKNLGAINYELLLLILSSLVLFFVIINIVVVVVIIIYRGLLCVPKSRSKRISLKKLKPCSAGSSSRGSSSSRQEPRGRARGDF